MTGKPGLFVLCILLAGLLCACPKAQDSSGDAAATASAGGTQSNPCGGNSEEAVANPHGAAGASSEDSAQEDYDRGAETEAAMQAVRNMVQALADGEADAFKACFHPESPELEEMTAMYEDWQGGGNTISITSLSVDTAMAGHAVVDYEFSISKAGAAAESEDGKMEMQLNEQGSWVIMDIS